MADEVERLVGLGDEQLDASRCRTGSERNGGEQHRTAATARDRQRLDVVVEDAGEHRRSLGGRRRGRSLAQQRVRRAQQRVEGFVIEVGEVSQ